MLYRLIIHPLCYKAFVHCALIFCFSLPSSALAAPQTPSVPENPSHEGHTAGGATNSTTAPSSGSTGTSSASSAAPSFTVTGTTPAGVGLTNTPPSPPPIPMRERLGAIVPQGIFLNDEHGNPVDVRSLMDIPTLIVPIFFTCPAACNTLLSSVAATLPNINLTPGKDFRVITVSFDETDTPALAARKKSNFLTAMNNTFPEKEWVFLTGDLPSIQKMMESIGFPFTRTSIGVFSHPVGVIVLAPGGKVSRYLYGQNILPVDLTMACLEAAEGKTGLSIKRMVAYCFTYDPTARTYVFSFMRVAGVVILFGAAVLLFVLLRGGKKRGQAQ